MRYRKLDTNGDYTFGQQGANFYKNVPEAVAQAIETNLGLIQGEWFLDTTIGTPYQTRILGMGRLATYDQAIKEVILNTQGVKSILSYSSNYEPTNRAASVICTVDTVYGQLVATMNYAYSSLGMPSLLDINFNLNQSLLG
jgi:hypothetical protein